MTAAFEAPGMPSDAALWVGGPEGTLAEGTYGRYTADTSVPLGSTSQWLASATLLSLADAGRLNLDDTLAELLPEAPEDKGAITLRQLLSHTSGLPAEHPCLADSSSDLAGCAWQILDEPLRATPGTEVYFGNASYQVAGLVAEATTGRSWSEIVDAALIRPLALESTGWAAGTNPAIGAGAHSSARDLGRFLTMLLRGGAFDGQEVLSADSAEALLSPQAGAARDTHSPVTDGGRMGLGTWIRGRGAATTAWAPGTFGATPWVDREHAVAGVWLVVDRRDRELPLAGELIRLAAETLASTTADPAGQL
ncbi:MAG: beta-lactamase family protein [Acidobacteria bacterium]|nr:beta-lactamase family protein [Acidobacteriota bacterium]